ncbi:radical SAM protein [Candidatus Woesearchaeota archaeon]|nr:MAG: radical SAM protein [Candidatus Woesearchaeota archaeon]
MELLEKASAVYKENFSNHAWFGKCIFLSWYCTIGDCTFCYRSTIKENVTPETARRSFPSILIEALFCKAFNWRLEFITGGYGILPFEETKKICKVISEIMGEKIWLNLGVLSKKQLEELKPYVKGIVASIETINPELHKKVCPSKPIAPYEHMFSYADGFEKSITFIVGLGETIADFELLQKFIEKHNINRITFYALKPVRGTEYEHTTGPKSEYYAEWIARTRIAFPKLEIMAGITPRRAEDVEIILRAGANAVTKFSATKLFNSERAHLFEAKAKSAGREFLSSLTKMPDIDWDGWIDSLDIDEVTKKDTKILIQHYLHRMNKPKSLEPIHLVLD